MFSLKISERQDCCSRAESRHDGSLLGGAGLAFETSERAMTGYVLARDVWGKGYAT
jgi:RimJ/RimL family protein N-acetyltransferase